MQVTLFFIYVCANLKKRGREDKHTVSYERGNQANKETELRHTHYIAGYILLKGK